MNEDGMERELLKELSSRLVMRREEVIAFLSRFTDDPKGAAKAVTEGLMRKGLIAYAYFGEGTYAITRAGMEAARGL